MSIAEEALASAASVSSAGDEAEIRDAYFRLVQGAYRPPENEGLQHRLDALDLTDMPDHPQELLALVAGSKHRAAPENPGPESLAFNAPLGLIEGAWLQGLARADNGHRAAVAELFAGCLALLGPDEAGSPAAAYRGLLARAGCLLPPVVTWQFSQDERVGLPALAFAALQLVLGHAASSRFAETIGFTLGYVTSDSPWRLVALEAERRRAVLEGLGRRAVRATQIHLASFDGAELAAQESRVIRGYALYQRAEAEYRASLEALAAHCPSPAEKVAEILRRKVVFARGYHGNAWLDGRSLDDWFAREPFDAAGFLQCFAASGYAAGAAGKRPFDRLTGFGGPMFGIFNREELALIGDWLDALPQSGGSEEGTGDHGASETGPFPRADGSFVARRHSGRDRQSPAFREGGCQPGQGRLLDDTVPIDESKPYPTAWRCALPPVRELFHRLVNVDRFPEAVEQARGRVERELRKARRALATRGTLQERFLEYSPQALDERIALIHREEVARYRPLAGKPKLEREEYLFGIRQFAPAILVDGCWLQHACSAAQQDDRLHRLLFHIYADELGAGRPEWNHPNVYRKLLGDIGMSLPEVADAAFAHDPAFLDSAFDLPVYLLGISLFPDRWLPELLGLNLAIELSGLGAQYLSLADEMEHWELDPLIVRLHLSIDSLAGGHAAWAVEAVQIHLERVRGVGGEVAAAEHWRRVWCGYLSLRTATRRFKWALGLAFCRRFLPGRLARCLGMRG